MQASKKVYNKCSENSRSQIVFWTDIFEKLGASELANYKVTDSLLAVSPSNLLAKYDN